MINKSNFLSKKVENSAISLQVFTIWEKLAKHVQKLINSVDIKTTTLMPEYNKYNK